MKRNEIPIYILAGGQSRRMGKDKLFQVIGEHSLLERTITTCLKITPNLKIVAKDIEKFDSIPINVLLDDQQANGPMAGIITALNDCKNDYCFITAADFYDLSEEIINTILQSYQNEQFFGLKINNRLQPLCGVFNRNCLPEIIEIARTQNYKMIDALIHIQSKFLDLSLSNWRNINSPDDLDSIRSKYV